MVARVEPFMTVPIEAPQPSPVLFFETINAYQRTQALKAAIELDLFTAIEKEKSRQRRSPNAAGRPNAACERWLTTW